MKFGKSRRKPLLVCIWNNYSFRGQTTIRFVCEQLLVRIRMNTALKPNDYWSLLRPILVAELTYIGRHTKLYRSPS